MNYEIFSYGNIDALSGLFNALAAITQANTFLHAIALVFVVGFFAALMAFAFAPDRMAGPRWLVSVILIYLVLFVPKATVHIVDKTGLNPPAVVANVPLGLAATAGIVSSVGNTLTDLFETALTVLPGPSGLPAEMTFSNNGLMFGARMVERSRQTAFADPALRADVVNFLQNCTFYDVSQGFIPPAVFVSSTNLFTLIGNTNPARFTGVTDPATHIVQPHPCPAAYALITARVAPSVLRQLERIGLELNPALQLSGPATLPAAAALTLIESQMPASYARAKVAAASSTAAEIVLQNAMINSVRDANLVMSQRTGDPSATLLGLARAQATAQLNSQSVASSAMMNDALPLIRNGIEAVLYGLFPFIILLAMVFGAVPAVTLLKSYALALAWIALWPPIYAIVNYLGTLAWTKKAASAAYMADSATAGLSLSTASMVYDTTVSSMSTMGNLVMAVPMIAAAVVFGLSKIAGMATSMSQAVSTATGPVANQAALGNANLGNVRFQQQDLSPNRSSEHMSAFTDLRGRTQVDERTGDVRYDQNIGKNVVSLGSSSEVATRMGEASARSQAFGQDQARAADRATSAAFDRILSNASGTSTGTAGSAGTSGGEGVSDSTTVNKMADIRDNLGRDLGISDRSGAASILNFALGLNGGGGGSVGAGSRTGGKGALGTDMFASASAEARAGLQTALGASGRQMTENQLSAAVKRARAAAEAIGVTDAGQFVDDYKSSRDFRELQSTNREEAERIAANIGEARGYRESASAAFRQSEEYRQSAELVKSAALSGKLDWTPEFNEFLRRNGALGVTGDDALMWANRFFQESGIGIGLDGQPKAVLFEGAGPGNVTVTPGSYRDPEVLRARAAGADLGQDAGAVAAWGQGNRALVGGIGTGSNSAPTSAAEIEVDKAAMEERILHWRNDTKGKVAGGQTKLEKQYEDAVELRSGFHLLGDQWDGRSGKQQIVTDQEEREAEAQRREEEARKARPPVEGTGGQK